MVLFNQRITKALIRLYGCKGWSAHLLFENLRRQVFSGRGPVDAWLISKLTFLNQWKEKNEKIFLDQSWRKYKAGPGSNTTPGSAIRPANNCTTGLILGFVSYSKTCLKWPLKNRQNKDVNDKWYLNEGRKYCRMLSFGAFCNTFDMHKAIIGLEIWFLFFLE